MVVNFLEASSANTDSSKIYTMELHAPRFDQVEN